MPISTDHPLNVLLHDAAAGIVPPIDGQVEVFPAPAGLCDAVVAFTGHAVLAGDVPTSWVRRHVQQRWYGESEHHPILSPHFLAALSQQLGTLPAGVSMLLAATPVGPDSRGELTPAVVEPGTWADYRSGVRSYCHRGPAGSGSISIGRGPAGRWDVWIGNALGTDKSSAAVRGRDLLRAAMTLVPPRTPLFASVPIHAARSIRMALAAGFRPLGAEVLYCTRAPD